MLNNFSGQIFFEEKLAPYTSWKVGGECQALVMPKSIEDIQLVLDYCNENKVPYLVLGNGSNILKSDEYFDGIVINISKTLNSITIEEDKVTVGSGCMLPKLAFHLAKNEIGDFAFYAGIPGTVGGGIVMNAGSAGKETKDVLLSVTYIDETGRIIKEPASKLDLDFRRSKFQGRKKIIVSAEFKKEYRAKDEALTATKEIADRRRKKFPLNVPTAGSTFKSPTGGPYPGKIIEDLGLKGTTHGKAKISERHGNWIENIGEASANDINELINYVQHIVKKKTGIDLEVEVIRV
ncbi:UDP-N-acetylmuramate dehydrogenase [Salipaludibacillus aurantiacus]|uniref:UDP-N-acetylenolpyruvoylglucosamine reductase n=1 Tax=Salipaludibacillus aurantiacus TaxID=1601833 RepID=A0A1H9X9S9_9BACI|nr:UDP-N-acetylmuramate dehydrogenase [Salipaludibacillus aurantiacus]SES42885.1 UDP-N-acetylmuramate dehydrogenase [Salipaludibacillus aurantiacus]